MGPRLGGRLSPLRIAGIYLAFGLAALLFSDVLLVAWIDDPVLLRNLQAAKGAVEVLVTAALIYALVLSFQRSYERKTEEIQRARDAFAFLNKLLRHHVLNRMNVVLGRLRQVSGEDETDRERLALVTEQSEAVVDLVQQVRTLAHTLEGEVALERTDLSALLAERVRAFEDRYESADVEADIADGVPIEADDALALAIDELLQNAVEHHDDAAPHVDVTLESEGDTATLRVADDGPGIADDRKETAFERGAQGNEGIGLYLTRTVVARHGGDVSIEDNEPEGTVVVVELPKAGAA